MTEPANTLTERIKEAVEFMEDLVIEFDTKMTIQTQCIKTITALTDCRAEIERLTEDLEIAEELYPYIKSRIVLRKQIKEQRTND